MHSAHSGKTARNGSRRPRTDVDENVAYLASYVSCLSSQVPSNMFRQSALASMNVERHDSLQSFCARNRDTHDSSTTPAHSPCLRRKVRSTPAQQVASHVAGMPSRTFVHRSVHEGASTQFGKSVAKGFKRRTVSRRTGASARMASKAELKRCRARAQSSAAAPTPKKKHNKNKRVNMANVKQKKQEEEVEYEAIMCARVFPFYRSTLPHIGRHRRAEHFHSSVMTCNMYATELTRLLDIDTTHAHTHAGTTGH